MSARSDRISLEFICGLGAEPVGFVEAAAKLGCRHIGIALQPIVTIPSIDANWNLRDPSLKQAFLAALASHDVTISVAEGFVAMPRSGLAANWRDDLRLLAELGAPCVNLVSIEPDRSLALDQCAEFAEAAAREGMRSTIEFMPGLPLFQDLPSALDVVRYVGRSNFGVMFDAMHAFRSGSTVAELAKLAPHMIGYVQICDVPSTNDLLTYADEARFERLAPGTGDLPLSEMISLLPDDCILGLELPMRSDAEAGKSLIDRLAPAVKSLRRLIDEASDHQ